MAFQAKRKFKRQTCRDGVRLQTPAGIEYATYDNLSLGGMALSLDREASLGSLIQLSFSIRGDDGQWLSDVKTMGRVVRSQLAGKSFDIGIQFINLDDSTRIAIQRLIDSNEGPF